MKSNLTTHFFCVIFYLLSYKTAGAQVTSVSRSIVHSPKDADAVRSKQPYQLTVTLLADVPNQSPVSVRVSVKNIGKKSICYFVRGYTNDFRFTVNDQYGHDAHLTEYGRQILMPSTPPGSLSDLTRGIEISAMNVTIPLKPGAEDLSDIPIGELFDLSQLGVYSISLAMINHSGDYFVLKSHQSPIIKPLNPIVIKSNTLRIKHDVEGFSLDKGERHTH